MTYKDARVYLDNVSKYGSVLGLDTIRELLCELGNPQDYLRFIHIAGTNGKGSVLAYISTVLSESGYRTGRYVSPTVVSYLERIQVNGQWIPEDTFARLTEIVQRAIARMKAAGKPCPTVFEIETAIAFLYFNEQQCDIVVLECGLGGEQDATNIIQHTLCAVFTTISHDHMGILGNTLEEIATVKSGIIKPGCIVVTAQQQPEVLKVLKAKAYQMHCPLLAASRNLAVICHEDWLGLDISYQGMKHLHCPLAGKYQTDNLLTALEVLRMLPSLGYPLSESDIRLGLMKTKWPGRFTCLCRQPLFFIDGAHNEDAARKLRISLETYFPGKRFIYIIGVFRDKEYEKIASLMGPLAQSVHTIELPDTGRTLSAEQLSDVMRKYCPSGTPVCAEESIENAVLAALREAGFQNNHFQKSVCQETADQKTEQQEDVILAFGSLSYLGQVMEIMNRIM